MFCLACQGLIGSDDDEDYDDYGDDDDNYSK